MFSDLVFLPHFPRVSPDPRPVRGPVRESMCMTEEKIANRFGSKSWRLVATDGLSLLKV